MLWNRMVQVLLSIVAMIIAYAFYVIGSQPVNFQGAYVDVVITHIYMWILFIVFFTLPIIGMCAVHAAEKQDGDNLKQVNEKAEILSHCKVIRDTSIDPMTAHDMRVAENIARHDARVAENIARHNERVAENIARHDQRVAENIARHNARVAENIARYNARVNGGK